VDNVDSGIFCTVDLIKLSSDGPAALSRNGEASMDRLERGFAVMTMTSFFVLIGAATWLMVLPV
jgi:hypothetical protein